MGSYKIVTEKITVISAIEDGKSELEELQSEMEEWFAGMSENLQQGNKGDEVQQAADGLQGALDRMNSDASDLPEELQNREIEIGVQVQKRKDRGTSRAVRCGNACSYLAEAAGAIKNWTGEKRAATKVEYEEDVLGAADDIADELEIVASEAESIDFPGMY